MRYKAALAQEKDVAEICHFIKLSYLPLKAWPDKILYPWITWYCQSGFASISREVVEDYGIEISGHITSLLLGRPAILPERAKAETFYHDNNGDYFYVDTIICPTISLIPILGEVLVKCVGMKQYLAFTRDCDNMKKLRIYKTKDFLRRYQLRKV